MRSCILLVYITVVALTPTPLQEDPDALYRGRQDPANASRAASIWRGRLSADARDYEAAWKLARAEYWLGDHSPEAARKEHYRRGVVAARAATAIEPRRADGHFWLASNLGGVAETAGLAAGLKYRGPIRDEFEAVTRLDPAYEKGGAYCALADYYLEVPALLGGSRTKAEELARRCVALDPTGVTGHYYLGEVLAAQGRPAAARLEWQRALDARVDPDSIPEDTELQARAARRLRETK